MSHHTGARRSTVDCKKDDKTDEIVKFSSKIAELERKIADLQNQIAAKETCEKYEENQTEKPIRDAGNNHEENILKMFCDIASRESSESDQQLSPNEIEKDKDIAENNKSDDS